MQADSSLVSQVIENGNAFPGRNGLRPSYIILHGTAGGTSAEAIARYFQSTQGGNNPVSAHYVIGTDGEIDQCNSEQDGAWANGYVSTGHDPWWSPNNNPNPNNITVSIEHCKASQDNSDALTPAQQDSSFKLITDICQRWGIPARAADANGGIIGHFSINPVNRQRCPGTYPWDQLWAFLNNGGTVISNSGTYGPGKGDFDQWFVANSDGTWTCKQTKAILMGGNLAFYSQLSFDGVTLPIIGLPLESERYTTATTSEQKCERAKIVYDASGQDRQPGTPGNSHLALIDWTPTTPPIVTVNKIPDVVIADTKQLEKDEGL